MTFDTVSSLVEVSDTRLYQCLQVSTPEGVRTIYVLPIKALYHYFEKIVVQVKGKRKRRFVLVMTSSRNLAEPNKARKL